jgi:hypothetical protein
VNEVTFSRGFLESPQEKPGALPYSTILTSPSVISKSIIPQNHFRIKDNLYVLKEI